MLTSGLFFKVVLNNDHFVVIFACSQVTLKYDWWHKELLSKFASLLDTEMVHFHSQISKSRSELEQKSIEASSTSDAVSLITYVQSLKRNMKAWGKQVEVYRNGQNILERQRCVGAIFIQSAA